MAKREKHYEELRRFRDSTLDKADFEYEKIHGNYRENERRNPDKARADFRRACEEIERD